jgi:hypothetical protein
MNYQVTYKPYPLYRDETAYAIGATLSLSKTMGDKDALNASNVPK